MGKQETATFAGGCFWCTEAIFQRLKGVGRVVSGYTGGNLQAGSQNPTWEDVATGMTGYAEAIQITFDPSVISYDMLLDVFWHLHDPTTLNRQGADTGTEYRSAIFYHSMASSAYHSEQQKDIAEKSKAELEKSGYYKDKVVTEIVPASTFYPAEPIHRDFYKRNQGSAYCQYVIDPKIQKLYKDYKAIVK